MRWPLRDLWTERRVHGAGTAKTRGRRRKSGLARRARVAEAGLSCSQARAPPPPRSGSGPRGALMKSGEGPPSKHDLTSRRPARCVAHEALAKLRHGSSVSAAELNLTAKPDVT